MGTGVSFELGFPSRLFKSNIDFEALRQAVTNWDGFIRRLRSATEESGSASTLEWRGSEGASFVWQVRDLSGLIERLILISTGIIKELRDLETEFSRIDGELRRLYPQAETAWDTAKHASRRRAEAATKVALLESSQLVVSGAEMLGIGHNELDRAREEYARAKTAYTTAEGEWNDLQDKAVRKKQDIQDAIKTSNGDLKPLSNTASALRRDVTQEPPTIEATTSFYSADIATIQSSSSKLDTCASKLNGSMPEFSPGIPAMAFSTDVTAMMSDLRVCVREIREASEGLRDTARSAAKIITDADAERAKQWALLGVSLFGLPGTATALPAVAGVHVPVTGTPADKHRWWKNLSPQQQECLIENYPDLVGGVDGLPGWVRDRANRKRIHTERARLQGELEQLENDDAVGPVVTGTGSQYVQRAEKIEQLKAKLASIDEVEKISRLDGRQILLLDLSQERAQAAVAVGNIDTAEHVAILSPGFTTTVNDGGLDGQDTNAAHLRERASTSRGRHKSSIAVISWIGYQAPQYETVVSSNSVALSAAAREGSVSLNSFGQGIKQTNSNTHLVAVGHSYGSALTGYALQDPNTPFDDGVVFGSPGLGTSNVDDFTLPKERIYYAEAKGDLVGDLGRFGEDPSELDIKHLETGRTVLPDGTVLQEVSGHSSYLDNNTTSQYSIAKVVAGESNEIVEGKNLDFGDYFRRGFTNNLLSGG